MGKPTGFKDYKRQEVAQRDILERIQDWEEIKCPSLPEEKLVREQAARCMDCSVPFCHSGVMIGKSVCGCPLHNLMPEFNDLVYHNMDEYAYARLNMTNNFPEFTSTVCPAPCEGACCASLATEAVAIHNVEQFIIENAFEKGYVKPNIPLKRTGKKVAVIGSGPAGLAAADQLNKAGHLVTVFERDDRPGGLLMYGIPTMKLDKAKIMRRVELLKAAGIEFRLNCEVGQHISSETLMEEYDAVVLCTGATKPRDLPIAGRNLKGIYFAKDYLERITKKLLDPENANIEVIDAKDKDVVIIGGGDTGNDCMAAVVRQGCRSVRQLQHHACLPHSRTEDNPWPEYARIFRTDYGQAEAIKKFKMDPREYCVETLEFLGADGVLNGLKLCQSEEVMVNGREIMRNVPGSEREVPAQLVLLAMGYAGTEDGLFEEFRFAKNKRGSIAAAESDYQTSIPGVFAAGDARRGQSLVVWAIAEGRQAAAAVDAYLNKK